MKSGLSEHKQPYQLVIAIVELATFSVVSKPDAGAERERLAYKPSYIARQ